MTKVLHCQYRGCTSSFKKSNRKAFQLCKENWLEFCVFESDAEPHTLYEFVFCEQHSKEIRRRKDSLIQRESRKRKQDVIMEKNIELSKLYAELKTANKKINDLELEIQRLKTLIPPSFPASGNNNTITSSSVLTSSIFYRCFFFFQPSCFYFC